MSAKNPLRKYGDRIKLVKGPPAPPPVHNPPPAPASMKPMTVSEVYRQLRRYKSKPLYGRAFDQWGMKKAGRDFTTGPEYTTGQLKDALGKELGLKEPMMGSSLHDATTVWLVVPHCTYDPETFEPLPYRIARPIISVITNDDLGFTGVVLGEAEQVPHEEEADDDDRIIIDPDCDPSGKRF